MTTIFFKHLGQETKCLHKRLTIELPETVTGVIPDKLEQEQELLRNVLAVALYKEGRLTKEDIRKLTRLSQHKFEE